MGTGFMKPACFVVRSFASLEVWQNRKPGSGGGQAQGRPRLRRQRTPNAPPACRHVLAVAAAVRAMREVLQVQGMGPQETPVQEGERRWEGGQERPKGVPGAGDALAETKAAMGPWGPAHTTPGLQPHRQGLGAKTAQKDEK